MEEFLKQIKNDHREFDYGTLETFYGDNPFQLFNLWYKEAFDSKQLEANAFNLSTVGEMGHPSSRILYLKELIDGKFVFFTNYNSQKGTELGVNPFASMLFFWPGLQRQIRIEGAIVKTEEKISDDYFHSRPRGSQIGAWASQQSEELDNRENLENLVKSLAKKYPEFVPRPPHWGGYYLIPEKFEFWQGRPSRLHDRIAFQKQENNWRIFRKNP
jgi:pyridoxamine 5'-phosphate oxidase